MSSSVRNQNRQRRAVAAALDRHKLFICSSRYRPGLPTITRVLVSGGYYDVSDHQLAKLKHGATPRALGLSPVADEQLNEE